MMEMCNLMQRIQYAKTKSDIIAKADGTFVPRERRKRHEDKGKTLFSRATPFLGKRLCHLVLFYGFSSTFFFLSILLEQIFKSQL